MVWRDVSGYEGIYQVNEYGVIKTLPRCIFRKNGKLHYIQKEKYLKNSHFKNGYYYVSLHKNGITKVKTVHSIVAESFILNPNNKRTVNHKDGNKLNNHISNLEWATDHENNLHAFETGLKNRYSLSAENIKTGKMIFFQSVRDAIKIGFNQTGISESCLKKIKNHKGYKFRYHGNGWAIPVIKDMAKK